MNEEKLIRLYQELHEHTLPACKSCLRPFSCCSTEYCAAAEEGAEEEWDVKLEPVDAKARLPFLGPDGCIVPPHMRPMCTAHTCEICSMGFTCDAEWDQRYFDLRDEISLLEVERLEEREKAARNAG